MTDSDYRAFQKEFDTLVNKHNLSAYALVVLLDSDDEEGESHTVVLSRVTPEEEMGVFIDKTRQVLFGLSRALIEIAESLFGLCSEATRGMLHGMVTDVFDDRTLEELSDPDIGGLTALPNKGRKEWH